MRSQTIALLALLVLLVLAACPGPSEESPALGVQALLAPPLQPTLRNVPYCVESGQEAPLVDYRDRMGKPVRDPDTGRPIQVVADPTHPGNMYVDIYRPATTGLRPVIIVVHGGGGTRGDKWNPDSNGTTFTQYATLAASAGYTVFNVNYPLSSLEHPERSVRFVDQGKAIECVVRFVKAHALKYGSDASNVTLLGGSWGAFLSLTTALSANTARPWAPLPYHLGETSSVHAVINLWGAAYPGMPADLDKLLAFLTSHCTSLDPGAPLKWICDEASAAADLRQTQLQARYGVIPDATCSNVHEGFSVSFPWSQASLMGPTVPSACDAVFGAYYLDQGDRLPILTIHGTADVLVPFEQTIALEGDASPLPGYPGRTETIVFPGANHGVIAHADQVQQIVRDWLTEKNPTLRHVDAVPRSAVRYVDWRP